MKCLFRSLCLLWFSFCGWCYGNNVTLSPADEFIITPKKGEQKKLSQRTLKERIGTATKHVFESTTHINQVLGELQCSLTQFQLSCGTAVNSCAQCLNVTGDIYQRVAMLQRQCSSIAEKLIDNEQPFKRASKDNLQKTLNTIDVAQQQLHQRGTLLSKLACDSKKTDASSQCTKLCQRTDLELKQLQDVMTRITTDFKADECLKRV